MPSIARSDLPSDIDFGIIRSSTIGRNTPYPVIDSSLAKDVFGHDVYVGPNNEIESTFMDTTATSKLIAEARNTRDGILIHNANSHSRGYPSAAIATEAFHDAGEVMLDFVNANPDTHTVVFVGSGATGALNRLARNLFENRDPKDPRDLVLYSEAEHHANILPWRKHAPRTKAILTDSVTGAIDLDHLQMLLTENKGRIRIVTITGTSNVTGLIPDIKKISQMVHEAGAELVIDAAQMASHVPIDMQDMGIDYLVMSGHKAYAPGSNGVLIMPKASVPKYPTDVGGDQVNVVTLDDVMFTDEVRDRESPGTPNITGAVMQAGAIMVLQSIGMQKIYEHERELTHQMMVDGLAKIPGVKVYASTDMDKHPRAGVVSFNIEGLYHAKTSKALSDYFNIFTRNGCFCAHPYNHKLLGTTPEEAARFITAIKNGDHSNTPGMVRASLGLYSNKEDVDRLLKAVQWLVDNKAKIDSEYTVNLDGSVVRIDGWRVKTEDYNPLRLLRKQLSLGPLRHQAPLALTSVTSLNDDDANPAGALAIEAGVGVATGNAALKALVTR